MPPGTSPYPVFGPRHQGGPYRVVLHVPTDGIEMVIILDRKRFEALLIHVLLTVAVTGIVPSSHIRGCHLLHEIRELTVQRGPEYEMPVIRHPAIDQNAQGNDQERFLDHASERFIVVGCLKGRLSPLSPLENMEGVSYRENAPSPRHAGASLWLNLRHTIGPRQRRPIAATPLEGRSPRPFLPKITNGISNPSGNTRNSQELDGLSRSGDML